MHSRATRKTKMMSKHSSILCLLLMTILLMGIGYSAINSITGEISGTVIAEQQNDVFITSVEYVSDVDADLAGSNITYYKGTYMQSTVKLSETNASSEITYKVTVYNNSENTYPFLTTLYDEEFYDNPNIVFEIKDTGFKVGDLINGKETKEIYITFKYKDGVLPENKTLNSNINFKIANPNRLKLASYGNSTSNYLGSTITRDKIESVKFELGTLQPEGTVASFDASEKQDESIIGYYTDTDGNGMYELTFLSAEPIAPNVNGQYLFQYLSNVTEITFNNFTTYGVTNMGDMFSYCSRLTELDVSGFDTSQVTKMSFMFSNCSGLTSLNVSSFDTRQVTNMGDMFRYCSGLKELDVSGFNTSQVTSMSSMFFYCSGLTELDVSGFDTSKVTNMSDMFYSCSGLTELDVSRWNTSKVTDMNQLFAVCKNLTNLDVSEWNTSQVTDMHELFQYCKIEKLDLSKWNTSQVTNMSCMFYYCSTLKSLDVSGFDTSQVTDMSEMFQSCIGLTELDLSGFDTSQVTDMSYMFRNCNKLTTIYVSEYDEETGTGWTTSAVTDSNDMFTGSTKLVGQNGTVYDSNYTDAKYAKIDKTEEPGYLTLKINRLVLAEDIESTGNYLGSTIAKDKIVSIKFEKGTTMEAISSFDASEKQDGSLMGYYTDTNNDGLYELTFLSKDLIGPNINGQYLFQNLTNVTEITFNNFATYGVTKMTSMFEECNKMTSVDVSKFDTRKVSNMERMFYNCNLIANLDLTNFNTSQVVDMNNMFFQTGDTVTNFSIIGLDNWDTSNVITMERMFQCTARNADTFNIGDLSNWNISNVTSMEYTFCSLGQHSKEFNIGNLDNWDTSKVTTMEGMFNQAAYVDSCDQTSFNVGDLSNWDTSKVTDMSFMFNQAGQNGTSFNIGNIGNWDTSNVKDMAGMFENTKINSATSNKIDFSNWDTSKVTSMYAMFSLCNKTVELDLRTFDTSQVTDMSYMFSGCSLLTSLDLTSFNTHKVKLMQNMFRNCYELTTIYVSKFEENIKNGWTTLAVTDSSSMFQSCSKLVGQNGTKYNSNYNDKTYARIDMPGIMGYLSEKPTYIPDGYTHVIGTNLDNGYVVQDSLGNQYVWIDVPRTSIVYKTAGTNITNFTDSEYTKIENDLKSYTSTYRNATTYTDKYYSTATTGLTQTQYNTLKQKMLKSIYQYGGFYIGRYETGTTTPRTTTGTATQTPVIRKNVYPYNFVTASQSQELSSRFATDGYITSLMFGIQWDLTMKYLERKGATQTELMSNSINLGNYTDSAFSITDKNVKYATSLGKTWKTISSSYSKGNGTSIITSTGALTKFSKQNIYDLAGNVYEWTLEHSNITSYPCANRGGNYAWSGITYPVGSRGYGTISQANDMSGFRTVLYKEPDNSLPTKVGKTLTAQTLTVEDYGGQVSNYNPTNGSPVGWRIFHTDRQNIYLIADNYIANQYKPRGKNGTTYSSSNGTYGSNLNAYQDYTGITDILSSLKTKWLNKYTYTSTYYNMRATAYLLDTNVWSTFKDSAGYADYAVGAPTLELFTASYNVTHDTDINVQASSSTGYKMKWSNSSTYSNEITGLDTTESLYIINNLYNRTVFGTWLASPNANGSSSVFLVRCTDPQNSSSARINYAAYTSNGGGLRPVVVLKSNYGLEVQADGTYKITEINQ